MRYSSVIIGLLISLSLLAQEKKKVLFIGNSYTHYNNLPKLVHDVANSVGDTLIYDSHTPGGARLMAHATNPVVHNKIKAQDWDFVTLQAQSQEPSWGIGQVQTEVYPHAKTLSDSIFASNDCARPMFYMTWGRKNGDQQNCQFVPWVCTYRGMDSALAVRYRAMAEDNNGLVSPVGAVWRHIRENYPNMELYTADGSHPSALGSYAAACSFYTTIFRKDPSKTTYNFSLQAADAQIIRQVTKLVVYDSLPKWNVGKYDPVAQFTHTQTDSIIQLTNTSTRAKSYHWSFGDNHTSTQENPKHTYRQNGTFKVLLTASACGYSDTTSIDLTVTGVKDTIKRDTALMISTAPSVSPVLLYPNPAKDHLNLKNVPFNSLITLFNDQGALVYRTFTAPNQTKINISIVDLRSGVYLLQVTSPDGSTLSRMKWMKQ